ncbi:alpha/beta hydrolase [Nostoc sp. FACHB-152]|uniref:alpha/beta hydrolase family protein n=1 Tax=unclassified Nostoc TaxID=2593658 RepID=UPI0016833AB2|nr:MULTISPECIES: alpha/beta hydrolase [unclassified Nostoc]MBD2452020.1 alpha/beta hydrolase [Nostoc sp. FACHB-152]MBD2473029.1 alpha/beta hydrolase [Nostoc sp. FACHB-145]
MKKSRSLVLAIVAVILVAFSWWGVLTAQTSLVIRQMERLGVLLLYIAPQNAENVPGVLIAHGYAGSKQLMLGYAYTLAHAGYAVMLPDFDSHAANAKPLGNNSLQQNLDVAYTVLLEQPEVDKSRLAMLRHSMGSGAVMSAAVNQVDRYAATVAVSPTGASITPNIPRNLLLQAGSWENRFVANAERLLLSGGGENHNFALGKARKLVIIPNAEHITILFRHSSHQAARDWLDSTFGINNQSNYIDYRMLWYFLHLLGWLIMLAAIAPLFKTSLLTQKTGQLKSSIGLLIAPFVATGTLVLTNHLGDIDSLGGVLVGGAVSIWFGVAGLSWLAAMLPLQMPPSLRTLVMSLILFIILWIGFGAMAQVVWLQWWLIPSRLQIFPLLAIACFPWFLASGIAQQNVNFGGRVLWWLGQSAVLIGGFILVLYFLPQLSFIYLLLPLFPVFMAIFSFCSGFLNNPWSYALGSTLFFGWVLASAFPLSS